MCERLSPYRCYIFHIKWQANTMLQNTITATCILLLPPLTAVSPAVAMAVTTPHAAQVQVPGGSKKSVYGCLSCNRAACGQSRVVVSSPRGTGRPPPPIPRSPGTFSGFP